MLIVRDGPLWTVSLVRAFPWDVVCTLLSGARRFLSLVIALVGAGACIVLSDTAPVSCVRVGVGRLLDPSSACVRRWWVPLARFVAAGPGVAFLWLLVRVFCACVRGSLFPLSLFSVGRWLNQPLARKRGTDKFCEPNHRGIISS